MPEDSVILAPEHYELLLERKKIKLDAMLQYAESVGKCRSQMLLAYFGERESTHCGQCDYCLGLQETGPSTALLQELQPQLRDATEIPIAFADLVDSIPFENKKLLINCIQWYIDQGQMQLKNDNLLQWKA
jgi:ATP-dependent DNA helicase RecQ